MRIYLILFFGMCIQSSLGWAQSRTKSREKISSQHIIGRPIVSYLQLISDKINTSSVEVNPLATPNRRTLYFSRKNHPLNKFGMRDMEDIWLVHRKHGDQWGDPIDAGHHLNNSRPNYVCQILPPIRSRGSMMFIFGNAYGHVKKKGYPLTYRYTHDGSKWTKPQPILIKNVTGFHSRIDCFMTTDRKILIISTDELKGYGNRDLYYCTASKGNNTFNHPVNLGRAVNTSGDESSPFVTADSKIMYFSSNGYAHGRGKHDVYVAARTNDNDWRHWATPLNLGDQINTDEEESHFNIMSDNETVLFSRSKGIKDANVYMAKLTYSPPLVLFQGKLVDQKTKKPVVGSVTIITSQGEWVGMVKSDRMTGEFNIHLPDGKKYRYVVQRGNYKTDEYDLDLTYNVRDDIKIDPIELPNTIRRDVETIHGSSISDIPKPKIKESLSDLQVVFITEKKPPTHSSPVVMTIHFDFNKSDVKPEYYKQMDNIAKRLNGNPKSRAELTGYTDATGSYNFNMQLSENRVKEVAQYLISKGVSSKNLKLYHRGSSNLIDTSETEQGNFMNRRVEIVILQ